MFPQKVNAYYNRAMSSKIREFVGVWVDTSRDVLDKSQGAVLLYDPDRLCYYETTIKEIILSVSKELDAKYKAKEAELDAKIKELEEKQTQFIADVTKANASVIELVEKTISED